MSLAEILAHYFRIIDPFSVNKQGNDVDFQYRTGIYYTKQTANQTFYEFDADIIDKIQQIQAVVPSGIITYTAHA